MTKEYGSLREKIAAEKAERTARYAEFARWIAEADTAGQKAAAECMPIPMVVVERANPLDDTSPVVREYAPVMDGVCGFAWVKLYDGNSSFARWAARNAGFRKGYRSGLEMWVGGYGQSYERKYAYALAYAGVLQSKGLRAYGDGRLD